MAYAKQSDAIKYNNEFIKKAYDRINFTVPKGFKGDIIQQAAKASNQSVNAFIISAIDKELKQQGFPTSDEYKESDEYKKAIAASTGEPGTGEPGKEPTTE